MKVKNRCRCGNNFKEYPPFMCNGDKSMTVKELFESNLPKIAECGKCGKVFQIERELFNEGGIC